MALNEKLETCNVPFRDHDPRSHEFVSRFKRKVHVPWGAFGPDHSYCGRRPHHYQDPSDMQWIPSSSPASVRRAARQNSICTACFKNWMYVQNRTAFIGQRKDW